MNLHAPATARRHGRLHAAGLAALVACTLLGTAQAQPDAAALYAQHCAACHQTDGSGTVGLAPSLKGEHWVRLGADRAYLPAVLVHGLSGPIKLGSQTFVGSMPAFGGALDDAALAALATHVRRLQGAPGDAAYSVDDIKAARTRPGSPSQSRLHRQKVLGS